jgi:hypothetical protein
MDKSLMGFRNLGMGPSYVVSSIIFILVLFSSFAVTAPGAGKSEELALTSPTIEQDILLNVINIRDKIAVETNYDKESSVPQMKVSIGASTIDIFKDGLSKIFRSTRVINNKTDIVINDSNKNMIVLDIASYDLQSLENSRIMASISYVIKIYYNDQGLNLIATFQANGSQIYTVGDSDLSQARIKGFFMPFVGISKTVNALAAKAFGLAINEAFSHFSTYLTSPRMLAYFKSPHESKNLMPTAATEKQVAKVEEKSSAPPPQSPPAPDAGVKPPEVEKPKPEFINHKVFAGETWESIAKWYLGDGRRAKEIASQNPNLSQKLKAGDWVNIPKELATAHKMQPGQSTAPPEKPKVVTTQTPPPTTRVAETPTPKPSPPKIEGLPGIYGPK